MREPRFPWPGSQVPDGSTIRYLGSYESSQLLTIHLRELEQLGLLHRQVYAQMPPKVEYSLTDQGRDLEPILRQLNVWGEHMGLPF